LDSGCAWNRREGDVASILEMMPGNDVAPDSTWSAANRFTGARGASPSRAVGYGPGLEVGGLRSMSAEPPPPGFSGESVNMWKDQEPPGRTSSFNNLAAALGSGLAESMDDATNGEHATMALLTDNFLSSASKDDISYARHSRHAASRLLGAGMSRDNVTNHRGLEAGSLLGHGDSTDKKRLGSIASASDLLIQDYNKERAGLKHTSLTQAFSADSLRVTGSGGFSHLHANPPASYANARLDTAGDPRLHAGEPDSFSKGSQRHDHQGTYGLQRDMQRLWSDRNQSSNASAGSRESEYSQGEFQADAEEELRPFCWDTRHHDASRALAITRAGSLSPSDVRSVCEMYGAIESFRSDFVERGVFFVSYYDMRCAQFAAMELQPRLQKYGPSTERVLVQFCVPLNSSSQNDESLVVLMDVPPEVSVDKLAAMLSSYGAVRSLKSMGGNYGGSSFVVEYHDVQDAKQAALELESTQQIGPNVSVEVGARNPSDRKCGRELLSLIGRWRHGGGDGRRQQSPSSSHSPGRYGGHGIQSHSVEGHRYDLHGSQHMNREPVTQLVLGPDGRYSYVVVNDSHQLHSPRYSGGAPPQYNDRGLPGHGANPYATHAVGSSQQNYWQPQTHYFSSSGSVVSHSSFGSSGHYPNGTQSLPYYRDGAGSVGSHSHRMSAGPGSVSSAGVDNTHLVLDLDAVENGRDARTSLMVRNIPNKYTQHMLLNEFMENGHGPGVIDFFYLPIDFKNRCNRGYAFINFVDTKDILAFHRQYFGKHWRTFNSDKICDITYARIQGKAAMLKRFENSALMEKDDEYKPLVFVSNGVEKGKKLPFPTPSAHK